EGRALYDGPPQGLTDRVAGRTYLAEGAGGSRRRVLAAALKLPDVIDGVIQGNGVRLVVRGGAGPPDPATRGGVAVEVKPAAPRFEDAFIDLLGGGPKGESPLAGPPRPAAAAGGTIVEARELTKRFGDFTAADRITFRI